VYPAARIALWSPCPFSVYFIIIHTSVTCTGTSATLALAGATTGNITFSETFADGDLVAYVVEDSGGSIKVAGTGSYVSSTDDITRDDNWNFNGSVVDDNPSTNITLSGGTHTVRCSSIGSNMRTKSIDFVGLSDTYKHISVVGSLGADGATTLVVNTTVILHTPHFIRAGMTIDAIRIEVSSAVASSLTRVGISSINTDGEVLALLRESANIDTSTTGVKLATITPIFFEEDTLVYSWLSSDSAITVTARDRRFATDTHFFPTKNGDDFRLYLGLRMDVSSGQPAYPTPVAFQANPNSQWPDILLRYE